MFNADWLDVALTASALLAIWGGWFIWLRPRWRRFWARVNGAFETLTGRDSITDPSSGRELSPAQPPLGNRLAKVEDAMSEVASALTKLTEVSERLTEMTAHLVQHDERLTVLERHALERAAIRAESAQMWRAVGNADAIEGEEEK